MQTVCKTAQRDTEPSTGDFVLGQSDSKPFVAKSWPAPASREGRLFCDSTGYIPAAQRACLGWSSSPVPRTNLNRRPPQQTLRAVGAADGCGGCFGDARRTTHVMSRSRMVRCCIGGPRCVPLPPGPTLPLLWDPLSVPASTSPAGGCLAHGCSASAAIPSATDTLPRSCQGRTSQPAPMLAACCCSATRMSRGS
jgi:hypothetical protein